MAEPMKQGHWPFYELRHIALNYPDQLDRMTVRDCNHPERDRRVAFVSPNAATVLWSKRDMKFNDDIAVEIDPGIQTSQIHFPQGDGTCFAPNV